MELPPANFGLQEREACREIEMKIAWPLVTLVVVAGAIASWIAAYYLLRNTVADQFSAMLLARAADCTSSQADALEQKSQSDPGNFAPRIELLDYYSLKSVKGTLTATDFSNRRAHILWTIEHEPESKFAGDFAASFAGDGSSSDPDGARKAADLWLQQVDAHSSNAHVLYSAGEFFYWSGNWQQSESLLERARSIKPRSFEISFALAEDYWHDANAASAPGQRRDLAARALDASEQAFDLANGDRQRSLVLPDATQAAYQAGDLARAEAWANQMVGEGSGHQDDTNYSDEIHYGNIVLGLLALKKGDLKGAGDHLVQAAATAGNPHLDTFGPNMMLARELLKKGDRKPVLEYLGSCGNFWKLGGKRLKRWRSEINAGAIPDFGANLHS